MLMSVMKRMMLDCEETARVVSRHLGKNAGARDIMNMYMHLMACPHCRKYYKQQRFISGRIRMLSKQIQNTPSVRLSASDKEQLQQVILKQ